MIVKKYKRLKACNHGIKQNFALKHTKYINSIYESNTVVSGYTSIGTYNSIALTHQNTVVRITVFGMTADHS